MVLWVLHVVHVGPDGKVTADEIARRQMLGTDAVPAAHSDDDDDHAWENGNVEAEEK